MTRKSKSIKYSKDFQDSAIRLSSQPGRTVASVAEELKIPAWRLHNWIRDSKKKLESSSDLAEIARLHNENKRLREENEFLKKAAAYFAKTHP
jgi:transposase